MDITLCPKVICKKLLMKEYINMGSKETWVGFGEALYELGKQNPDIVAL
jgi:hypothetical protein